MVDARVFRERKTIEMVIIKQTRVLTAPDQWPAKRRRHASRSRGKFLMKVESVAEMRRPCDWSI